MTHIIDRIRFARAPYPVPATIHCSCGADLAAQAVAIPDVDANQPLVSAWAAHRKGSTAPPATKQTYTAIPERARRKVA